MRFLPRLVAALLVFLPLFAACGHAPHSRSAFRERAGSTELSSRSDDGVRASAESDDDASVGECAVHAVWTLVVGGVIAGVAALALLALAVAAAFATTATSVTVGVARRSVLDGLSTFLALGGASLGALLGVPGGVLAAWLVRCVIERPFDVSTSLLLGAFVGPAIGGACGAAAGLGLGLLRRRAPEPVG